MGRIFHILLVTIWVWGWGYVTAAAAAADAEPLTVFAAASTKAPMDAIAAIAKSQNIKVTMVYAGSSLLARQIENGAPADVFVSAHPLWIKYLNEKSVIDTQSIANIASNKLVLIANKNMFEKNKLSKIISPNEAIGQYLQSGFLAVADPDHVPAGIYAKEALTNIGLWNDLKNKLARTLDVTAALALVANGEAPLGIVYASDVFNLSDTVAIVSVFNNNDHASIIYSAVTVKNDDNTRSKAATQFIDILKSNDGKKAFIDYGFTKPIK